MQARTAAALIATVATLVALLTGCDPVSGGACDPIGIVQKDKAGQVWTCAENANTGKGYWYKGTPGVPDGK